MWQSEQSEKIRERELKLLTLSHPKHGSLTLAPFIHEIPKVDHRIELSYKLLVPMLLKAHKNLKPLLLTSLNHLNKDRIIFPLHKVPINKLSIIGNLSLSTSDDGCGVIILLECGP
jgi:hypothetical protein